MNIIENVATGPAWLAPFETDNNPSSGSLRDALAEYFNIVETMALGILGENEAEASSVRDRQLAQMLYDHTLDMRRFFKRWTAGELSDHEPENSSSSVADGLAHIQDAGEALKAVAMHIDDLLFAKPQQEITSRQRHILEMLITGSADHYNRILNNVERVAVLVGMDEEGLDEAVRKLRNVDDD